MGKFGVDIIWTSRYDYGQGGKLNLHEHDFYQIIYFVDGKGEFTLGGESYPFVPGIFFFIHPKVQHGFVPYGNCKIKTLDLKFRILDPEVLKAVKGVQAQRTDVFSEVKTNLEQIRLEGLEKQAYYGELACLSLLRMLYTLSRNESGPSGQKQTVRAAAPAGNEPLAAARRLELYIQEHYAEELSLGLISEQLNYSKNYLSHMFKINYGCTFSSYLRKTRIERSKELIAYSALSLKQVAETVGFKTVYHFSRVFKETEGMNPGEWKLRELEGIRKDVHFE